MNDTVMMNDMDIAGIASEPPAVAPPVAQDGVGKVSPARRSLFAASHLAAQSMILFVISVPALAYIVRSLGATGYGQWTAAVVLVGTVGILTNLGLRGAFVRAVARKPESAAAALAEQLGARLLLSLLACGMVMGACFLLYPAVVIQCAIVGCVGMVLTTISSTLSDLLQGLHRISVYAGTNFIAGLALTGASVAAMWLGYGPVGLAVSYLVGPIISTALLLIFVQSKFFAVKARVHPRKLWDLLVESRYFAAQQIVNTVGGNEESLMLPKIVGAGPFGLFSGGMILASRLVIIPDSLGSAFYPQIAHAHAKDPKLAARQMVQFMLMALMVCLPITVAVLFFAGPLAHVLFSKNAELCQRVMSVTIWSLPMLGVGNVMGYGLNAVGKDSSQAKMTLYTTILSLASAVVLVTMFGVIGACWSYLLRIALGTAGIAYLFLKNFSPRLEIWRFTRILICGCAMAGAMWLARPLIANLGLGFVESFPHNIRGWSSWLTTAFLEGMIGITGYVVALMVSRTVRPGDLAGLIRRSPAV